SGEAAAARGGSSGEPRRDRGEPAFQSAGAVADRRWFLRCIARRCLVDGSGRRRIGERAKGGRALLERLLPACDGVELLFELLLIEQLPAGHAIDLAAHLRDAIFVRVL